VLSSFVFALTVCSFVGAIIVVALAARARTDASIARVLYDTEHPAKMR
jgi:hypothetical protein